MFFFFALIATDDLLDGESIFLNLKLVMGSVLPSTPTHVTFMAIQDDLNEGEECLMFDLSINETALDPRDREHVDIANNIALLRIQDPALTCSQDRSLITSILVNCEANFPFNRVTCSFDGAPLQPCEWIYYTIRPNHSIHNIK